MAGLGRAAMVLASLWTMITIAMAVAAPSAVRQAAEVTVPFTGYVMLQLALAALLPVTYVVSCLFLSRARANTIAMDPHADHKRSQVWLWLGWIFPVLNLWFPYRVVADIVRASAAPVSSSVLTAWWATWLLAQWSAATASSAVQSSQLANLPAVSWLAAGASLASLVCWVAILQRVSAAQAAYADRGTLPGQR